MCLVLVSHTPGHLTLAANRDELHARPAAPLHAWEDRPHILAGRDLEAGGTWLGLSARGRLAAVTNLRGGAATAPRSRGQLVVDFLDGTSSAAAFAERLEPGLYRPFNLLVWDGDELAWASSAGPAAVLPYGLHGLSNAPPGTPWPKVVQGEQALGDAVAAKATPADLIDLLADDTPPAAPTPGLQDLDPSMARAISARFVRHAVYGTRASTAVVVGPGEAQVTEQTWGPSGAPLTRRGLRVQLPR